MADSTGHEPPGKFDHMTCFWILHITHLRTHAQAARKVLAGLRHFVVMPCCLISWSISGLQAEPAADFSYCTHGVRQITIWGGSFPDAEAIFISDCVARLGDGSLGARVVKDRCGDKPVSKKSWRSRRCWKDSLTMIQRAGTAANAVWNILPSLGWPLSGAFPNARDSVIGCLLSLFEPEAK